MELMSSMLGNGCCGCFVVATSLGLRTPDWRFAANRLAAASCERGQADGVPVVTVQSAKAGPSAAAKAGGGVAGKPAGWPAELQEPEELSSKAAPLGEPLLRFLGEFVTRCCRSHAWHHQCLNRGTSGLHPAVPMANSRQLIAALFIGLFVHSFVTLHGLRLFCCALSAVRRVRCQKLHDAAPA